METEIIWKDFDITETAMVVDPDACAAAKALAGIGLVLEQGIRFTIKPSGLRVGDCVAVYRTRAA